MASRARVAGNGAPRPQEFACPRARGARSVTSRRTGAVISRRVPARWERPRRKHAPEYVAWLAGELAGLQSEGSVDVVGHDWGGAFVVRLVSTRPDLVRSWVTDAAGVGDTGFEWHEYAKVWQTPGAGEEFFERQLAQPVEARARLFERAGASREQAVAIAGALDETMVRCILALYRSAVDVGRQWAPEFRDIAAPGVAVVATEDPFLSPSVARAAAARAGAAITELSGLGHWWMLEDPARGARLLEEFWESRT